MADDPYVYAGTNVLKNLADIRSVTGLRDFESISTFRRLLELEYATPPSRLDTAHLKAIHRYIFQDVYSWAGEFRTVDMGKEKHWFCRLQFIQGSLSDLLAKLRLRTT